MASTLQDRSIPLPTLAAYGSLAFPMAAGFIALQVIIPTFYAQVLGLSLGAVGGILLVARLWDMVTDPLVGYLSDRTPARWGRRKVWVVASAPLIAGSVWMLFNPGQGVSNSYLLLGAMAIYIAGTMALVPIQCLGSRAVQQLPPAQPGGRFQGGVRIGGHDGSTAVDRQTAATRRYRAR